MGKENDKVPSGSSSEQAPKQKKQVSFAAEAQQHLISTSEDPIDRIFGRLEMLVASKPGEVHAEDIYQDRGQAATKFSANRAGLAYIDDQKFMIHPQGAITQLSQNDLEALKSRCEAQAQKSGADKSERVLWQHITTLLQEEIVKRDDVMQRKSQKVKGLDSSYMPKITVPFPRRESTTASSDSASQRRKPLLQRQQSILEEDEREQENAEDPTKKPNPGSLKK